MLLADTRKLLRIPEVALILNISKERAYQLAREGILPVVRLGFQVRVDPTALREWIRSGGARGAGQWGGLPRRKQPDRRPSE